MEYELIDKLMPQEGGNPERIQGKINSLLSTNNEMTENELNEILAGVELEGFRKGLRMGMKLCCEIMNTEL